MRKLSVLYAAGHRCWLRSSGLDTCMRQGATRISGTKLPLPAVIAVISVDSMHSCLVSTLETSLAMYLIPREPTSLPRSHIRLANHVCSELSGIQIAMTRSSDACSRSRIPLQSTCTEG
jgi:hypothetical protein